MILASHNSFSYLKPLRWWLRPFHFVARCQSENILSQHDCGARIFDLRVAFDKKHRPRLAHGLMTFKGSVYDNLAGLDALSAKQSAGQPIQVRVLKERSGDSDGDFTRFCRDIESRYRHLRFGGGRDKKSWRRVYDFGADISVYDAYSSWNHDGSKPGTGTILDDWCPALYARRNNARHLSEYSGEAPLMLDFIGKYGFNDKNPKNSKQ